MTLAMQRALEIINYKKNNMSLRDLEFFLIALRDNALDDEAYKVLNRIIASGIIKG